MSTSAAGAHALNVAAIPPEFTDLLVSLGYIQTPFSNQQQEFENQVKYQQVLKNVLDSQMQAFGPHGVGTNTAMLPANLRNMFGRASSAFSNPMYSGTGYPGFFGGGWKFGALPSTRSPAHEFWANAANNYPGINPPAPVSGGGGDGTSAGSGSANQYTVQLPGGGSININAGSQQAAIENAQQQTPELGWGSGFNPNVGTGFHAF